MVSGPRTTRRPPNRWICQTEEGTEDTEKTEGKEDEEDTDKIPYNE
jgi:hypothetical protein